MSRQNNNAEKTTAGRAGSWLRKNLFSLLMVACLLLLFFSPGAKSWVLQQLMATGLFNANLETEKAAAAAPEAAFNFINRQGEVQSTASFRGKVVFINFWASWCPPCRAEMPSIEQLYQSFRNNPNVVVLTISEDRHFSAAQSYLEREGLTLPVYQAKGSVPEAIYKGVLPTTVVLDKNGKIRYRHEGFASYASEQFMEQIRQLVSE